MIKIRNCNFLSPVTSFGCKDVGKSFRHFSFFFFSLTFLFYFWEVSTCVESNWKSTAVLSLEYNVLFLVSWLWVALSPFIKLENGFYLMCFYVKWRTFPCDSNDIYLYRMYKKNQLWIFTIHTILSINGECSCNRIN